MLGWELELTFEVNKQMTADCDVTICLLFVNEIPDVAKKRLLICYYQMTRVSPYRD